MVTLGSKGGDTAPLAAPAAPLVLKDSPLGKIGALEGKGTFPMLPRDGGLLSLPDEGSPLLPTLECGLLPLRVLEGDDGGGSSCSLPSSDPSESEEFSSTTQMT